jgi:hypothetical protein
VAVQFPLSLRISYAWQFLQPAVCTAAPSHSIEIAVNVHRTTSAWIPAAHGLSGWQVIDTA